MKTKKRRKRPPAHVRRQIRPEIHAAQGGLCYWCRQPIAIEAMTLDHVRPACKGGTSAQANLVGSCRDCNQAKGKGFWWAP